MCNIIDASKRENECVMIYAYLSAISTIKRIMPECAVAYGGCENAHNANNEKH